MKTIAQVVFLCLVLLSIVDSEENGCVIELDCPECLPDYMPLVAVDGGGGVDNGTLRVAEAGRVTFTCGAGRFAEYPLASTLAADCVAGRYKLPDGSVRHLLDLGCQQDVIEDVLHPVEHCGSGLQGRAYRVQTSNGRVRHLAALCYDADRALPLRAHVAARTALSLPAHSDARQPLSLLGNFNEMFDARTRLDAERLFGDEARLERRLRAVLRPARVALGEQRLAAAALLSPLYFAAQDARAAALTSGQALVWRSVARGNLRHTQRDVGAALRRCRRLHVYTGTHGTLSLRGAGNHSLALGSRGRFPVPRYLWTVVLDPASRRALALLVFNDPLVAVSEVRDAVFCESMCGRVTWLHELMRNRNYEVPALGLTFCCPVHDIQQIKEFPAEIVKNIPSGMEGALLEVLVD